MDTLHVENFEFENKSYQEIQKIWETRGLWFFKIEKREDPIFNIKLDTGNFLKEVTGKNVCYKTLEKASEAAKKLENYEIMADVHTYYLASSDQGRYISTTNGQPVEFPDLDGALKMAISYNNDIVKIRMAFSLYQTK